MQFSNKLYDVLKWLVLVVVPALTTFYVVLDKIFGWGLSETVATISSAACACVGAIIGISTAQYNKGLGNG